MYSLLLAIIYVAFISLGLPDSLLGAAWPSMYGQLNVPMANAGILTMIIAGGTIVSSLFSDKLTRKLGAGMVTAISVLMTAAALFGFSISGSFIMLCLFAVPYGLGAGAVDAALNNYVALNYASRHMTWLHCFWGVGAAVSPYIMSFCLTNGWGWGSGYRTVSVVQVVLTVILFLSLPLWKKKTEAGGAEDKPAALSFKQTLNIKGVKLIMLTFFSYCALESTTGLWASSFLVQHKKMDPGLAAQFSALFFLGITFGRLICGFIADKAGDRLLIRLGISTIVFGAALVLLPLGNSYIALGGLVIIGLGCAPVYPAIIHATPDNFGKENSQAIIGIQMASAYTGTTFMPLLFGLIAEAYIGLFPIYLMFFALLMLLLSERLNFILKRK